MSGVKIKKIPMKNLSPKEMAELAFDQGVTRGGSGTANTLKRGGLKRGAYGQGVGKYKDGGDVKYKGPLPKSKPTKLERLLNKRVKGEKGPYKPKIGDLNEEIAGNLGKQDEQMMYGGKVEKYFDGGEVRGMGKAYQGGKRSCKVR